MEINRFLADREKRIYYQKKLSEEKKLVLVTLRVNFPGIEKDKNICKSVLLEIDNEILKVFKPKYKEIYRNLEGLTYIYLFDEKVEILKKEMINIEEEHSLGRLVDIDVYIDGFRSISRKEFGKNYRKCYLCDNDAKICSRGKKHEYTLIKEYIYEKYRHFLAHKLSTLACQSSIYELITYPSFGLVSHKNSGSHEDMDMFSFIKSTFIIQKAFYDIVLLSYSDLDEKKCFELSRNIGKRIEKEMFEKIGVNTHKGLIFLMLICLIGVSKNIYYGYEFENISNIITKFSSNIYEDFYFLNKKGKLTNGERIYINYGIKGIREIAYSGFKDIFEKFLPLYEKYVGKYSLEKALYLILLNIMSCTDDTTIINRCGIEKLNYVKKKSKELLNSSIEEILEFDKFCIENNISPGGSADILTIVLFLYNLKIDIFKEREKNYEKI